MFLIDDTVDAKDVVLMIVEKLGVADGKEDEVAPYFSLYVDKGPILPCSTFPLALLLPLCLSFYSPHSNHLTSLSSSSSLFFLSLPLLPTLRSGTSLWMVER